MPGQRSQSATSFANSCNRRVASCGRALRYSRYCTISAAASPPNNSNSPVALFAASAMRQSSTVPQPVCALTRRIEYTSSSRRGDTLLRNRSQAAGTKRWRRTPPCREHVRVWEWIRINPRNPRWNGRGQSIVERGRWGALPGNRRQRLLGLTHRSPARTDRERRQVIVTHASRAHFAI